jgi:multiple sugar transport system substrate-binding protein
MLELQLSLMGPSGNAWTGDIQQHLKHFEERGRFRVHVSTMDWETAWVQMVRSSIYGKSPSVSEVGTSWVSDLVGMNALYALPDSVTGGLGGELAFLPQSWKSCFLVNTPQMWAAPWVSGARVLYYRKDMLIKAGVDAETAFSNPAALLNTLAQLQSAGIAIPLTLPTTISINTMHYISSWVWAAGGDFISSDGQKILFTEKESVDGMANFYALGRYLGPKPQERSYETAINMFWQGDAAVTIDGTWMHQGQKPGANPAVLENLGIALLPGPSFVGGSNLVIWTNTLDKDAAMDLLRYMMEPEVVLTIFRYTGLVPAQRSLLNLPEVAGREFGAVFNQAIETGRSWPNCPFSAMLEGKMQPTLGQIWMDVLASPEADLQSIIIKHLEPLKQQLKIKLSG